VWVQKILDQQTSGMQPTSKIRNSAIKKQVWLSKKEDFYRWSADKFLK
jgi:hypothetical protein